MSINLDLSPLEYDLDFEDAITGEAYGPTEHGLDLVTMLGLAEVASLNGLVVASYPEGAPEYQVRVHTPAWARWLTTEVTLSMSEQGDFTHLDTVAVVAEHGHGREAEVIKAEFEEAEPYDPRATDPTVNNTKTIYVTSILGGIRREIRHSTDEEHGIFETRGVVTSCLQQVLRTEAAVDLSLLKRLQVA